MSNRLRFRSVRTRQVFWLLLVSLIPQFVVVAVLYYERAAVMKARGLETLQTIRDLKTARLNEWIDERTGDLKVVAGDQHFGALGRPPSSNTGATSPTAYAVALEGARHQLRVLVRAYDSYEIISFVRADGVTLVSSDSGFEGRVGKNFAGFAEVMQSKRLYLGDIRRSETTGEPAMNLAAPVFCARHQGQHLVGVVVATIDLERSLYPLLRDEIGYGRTGETLIVNEQAIALNDLRWHESAPLRLKISAVPAVRAANGETGVAETPDYRGEMVLAAYTHIPRTGWGFVAKRDLAEIYDPIDSMVRNMAAVLALSACIVLLVALFLGRTIASPILAIAGAVGRIRGGQWNARCEVQGADEMAGLAAAINAMADKVVLQMGVQEAGTEIANVNVNATSVEEFAVSIVRVLMRVTDSNIGAFFQRRRGGQYFESVTSVGLNASALHSFDGDSLEGEFGQALSSRAVCYTRNLPSDTEYTFKTVTGLLMPREIVTLPIIVDGQVLGILSFATVGGYTEEHRDILDQAWIGLGTVFSNLLASQDTSRMAGELQAANEELQSTNEELQSQAEELQAQAEELEVQRRQVEEADQLKSDFLSNMSHELRTPLNSVLALTQLMLSRGVGEDIDKDLEFLRVIERNGRQLLDLINDILDLSKIEAGRQEVSIEKFDPGELASSVMATVRPLAVEKNLTATFSDPGTIRDILNDRGKVRQILLNLLSNAIKFTDAGGVELSVSQTVREIIYVVSDTGPGIAPGDEAYIFDEFRQLDGSTTRKYGGTGLGLTISRRLARLLGGDLSVESTPGRGSNFSLVLPATLTVGVADVPTAGAVTPSNLLRPSTSSHSVPRVLVVEDDDVAVMQIRGILEDQGCDVCVAHEGAEALECVRTNMPDAMVLDLMMPNVDGFTVLEEIHALPSSRGLAVLVLTAKQLSAAEHARLAGAGMTEFAQKGSVDRRELGAIVRRLIDTSRLDSEKTPGLGAILHPAGSAGVNVLVVEDNPDNMLTIVALLDDMGVNHTAAYDGEEAVRMASQEQPDLILMDLNLPLVGGLDATRQIKADPALKHIPIVAVTATAMVGEREAILSAGCDDHVSKPIEPAVLKKAIVRMLGRIEAAHDNG